MQAGAGGGGGGGRKKRVQQSKSAGLGEHVSVWDVRESKKEQQEEGELVGNKKMKVEWRGESESVWERGREREREMGWGGE